MNTPTDLQKIIIDRILDVIREETDGIAKNNRSITEHMYLITEDVLYQIFGDEIEGDDIEELCEDMDKFTGDNS